MIKRMILYVLTLAFGSLAFGQDFTLTLVVPQTKYIMKEPIIVKGIMENKTEEIINIAYGEKGLKTSISMTRADGEQRRNCILPETTTKVLRYTIIEAAPGWKKEFVEDLSWRCKDDPGEFIIQFAVSSKGPYINYSYDPEGPRKVDEEIAAWKGALSSEPIRITIDQPQGEDKKAYDYFKGEPMAKLDELLKKFPSSTYAAYVVYDRLKGFADADFNNPKFLRSLETGIFLSNSYPTEGGWSWMKDEMNAAWWSKWAGIILKNHPDIWFADELRLRLAMNQVALKNYQAAEADFIKLSKEAKPCIAEKAALFVEIMKQKGWASAPVEKSVPEAVVVK